MDQLRDFEGGDDIVTSAEAGKEERNNAREDKPCREFLQRIPLKEVRSPIPPLPLPAAKPIHPPFPPPFPKSQKPKNLNTDSLTHPIERKLISRRKHARVY